MNYIVPFRFADLNGFGCHILCDALVEGYKMNMIIDTGASMTVLDINRLKKINPKQNLKPTGQFFTGVGGEKLDPFSTVLDQMQIGDLRMTNVAVLATDLAHIMLVYSSLDLDRVDGVLGNDLLRSLKARIDYSKKLLELEN
jgi:predicted aspartyl protease